ncbi:MAG: hypothetical protein N3A38_15245 [Planctomycetota bacterium]|nr:hypothetical protein [Planctomycetota bacterium]
MTGEFGRTHVVELDASARTAARQSGWRLINQMQPDFTHARTLRERFARHLEVLRKMREGRSIRPYTVNDLRTAGIKMEEAGKILESVQKHGEMGRARRTEDGRYFIFVKTIPDTLAREERAGFLFHEVDHIVKKQRDPGLMNPAEPPWLYMYAPTAAERMTCRAQNDFRMLFPSLRRKRWSEEDIESMIMLSLRAP